MSTGIKRHETIYYYLFLLLAFLLPVFERIVPAVVILIVINWLAEGRFRIKLSRCLHDRRSLLILSFSAFYLLYLISLAYSANFQQGLADLQVGLSLLVFPVIFSTTDRQILSRSQIGHIFLAFVAGTLLYSLFMIAAAYYRYMGSAQINEFLYIKLAVGRHPAYFDMYIGLAMAIIFNYMSMNWKSLSYKMNFLLFFLLAFFSFMVLLLCSKAGIIVLNIVFIVLIINSLLKNKELLQGILLSILFVSFFITAFYLFPPTIARFNNAFNTLYHFEQIDSDDTESTATRILIWKSAWQLFEKQPVAGYGIGDVREALAGAYENNQFQNAVKHNLNAHCQYFQTVLIVGIPGLILLLSSLLIPIIISRKEKNAVYLVFLVIIGINFLFESMLCRQAGVVFFAFFNGFLLKFSESEKTDFS